MKKTIIFINLLFFSLLSVCVFACMCIFVLHWIYIYNIKIIQSKKQKAGFRFQFISQISQKNHQMYR